MRTLVLPCLTLTLLGAVPALAADTIYVGGDILTMAGKEPSYVEALVVTDGKIAFAGSEAGAMKHMTGTTKVVDLDGHTMLPGFIDTHGHMIYFGKNMIDADLFGERGPASNQRGAG